MDRYLGYTLGRLDGHGLRNETLVIFASDHGDEFDEHGRLGHGITVYDEVVRVPLIFSLPGVLPAGRRSAQSSGLVDILPTVADLVGAPIPPQAQGRSLLPALLSPDAVEARRPIFAREQLQATIEASDSVRFGRWKLIRRRRPGVYARFGDFDLFDTQGDPDEVIDRWGGELVVGHGLRQMLVWHQFSAASRRAAPSPPIELGPEVRKRLRALGYIQ